MRLSFLQTTGIAILTLLNLPLASAMAVPSSSSHQAKTVCIVGGGPAGLFLAHLLLQQDKNVKVNILEKAPSHHSNVESTSSYGMGLGRRHRRILETVPGLWPRLERNSVPATGGPPVRMISRSVLCQELLRSLEENDGSDRCTVSFDTSCETVNLEQHSITTKQGTQIQYDLLVACDGINSKIRQQLVQEKGLQEEHYLRDSLWKVLKIPKQPKELLDPGAFKPLSHPLIKGAIFPRFSEGHTALFFWKDMDLSNPKGIQTEKDLIDTISQALQPKQSKWDLARKLFFLRITNKESSDKEIKVNFDTSEAARCVESKPRTEHYLKLDRYHDSSSRVALLGDAAHGMYTFLGQGAACAFSNSLVLSQCWSSSSDTETALAKYSELAVPEGHAANDLNLVTHAIFGSLWAKLLAIPLLLMNATRGKLLMKRIGDDVSYQQLYQENSWLMGVARYFWKKSRVPLNSLKANKSLVGTS